MLLRDAAYLYSERLGPTPGIEIIGEDCDVLQLLLDVEKGFSDLSMHEGPDSRAYPDRIFHDHELFAYALYSQTVRFKRFTLSGDRTTTADTTGLATIFAYCFSTKKAARVFKYVSDQKACIREDRLIPCPNGGTWTE